MEGGLRRAGQQGDLPQEVTLSAETWMPQGAGPVHLWDSLQAEEQQMQIWGQGCRWPWGWSTADQGRVGPGAFEAFAWRGGRRLG